METINYSITYNTAIKYLQNKYGYRRLGYTSSFRNKLNKKNREQQKELIASATDRDYELKINLATDTEDKEIELLLSQYPYGYKVREELYNKLCTLGVIKS